MPNDAIRNELCRRLMLAHAAEADRKRRRLQGEGGGGMNKYVIDYGYGRASLWTESSDPKEVRGEFHQCANDCFGIRKSLASYEVVETHTDVALPLPYRGHAGTVLLHYGFDNYALFDLNVTLSNGDYWKLHDEGGDWCSCRERGKPERSCGVHSWCFQE